MAEMTPDIPQEGNDEQINLLRRGLAGIIFESSFDNTTKQPRLDATAEQVAELEDEKVGPEEESRVYDLSKLTDIDDPIYAGKVVLVKAVIASNTTSYNVPVALDVTCKKLDQHNCPEGKTIELLPKEIARYPDNPRRDKLNEELAETHFTKSCYLAISEHSDTLYRVRIRPNVTSVVFQKDSKTTDESGLEYKAYDIFLRGKQSTLEPGSVYEVTAVVIPDPRTQKVTLFVVKISRDSGSEYDIEKIGALAAHLEPMTVQDRVDWFISNFQKYSKVRKREDVILASFLTFFSPTYVEFDGKRDRGWIIAAAVGDSTTGKSEVNKHMIKLTGGGQYIVAETASMVGLAATATQTTNGWFVEWGPLVLGDRRLIVLDGAQKLTKRDWSTLAEAQRLGLVKLTKAAKGEAYARTRQMIIANPLDLESFGSTKEMDAFLYPYMAVATLMDTVTIARLDLAVFVTAGDVTAEDINQTVDEQPDPYLANVSDLRAYAWQGQYSITYDDLFTDAVHAKATELYNKFFVKNVPLVSIDMKYKLVRLSTALAIGTCSLSADLDTVNVTKEHVHYVAQVLDKVYTAAGVHEGRDRERDGDLNGEQVQEIINAINGKTGIEPEKIVEILKWMGGQPSFSMDQLKTIFELAERNQLKPLIGLLQSESIIARVKGFVITSRGVRMVKILLERN